LNKLAAVVMANVITMKPSDAAIPISGR